MATGGGAFKFYNRMREVLHVDVIQEDEMECLIIGQYCSGMLGALLIKAEKDSTSS